MSEAKKDWAVCGNASISHDLPVESYSICINPYIAKVYGDTPEEAEKRSHLIAASPDMYKALQEAEKAEADLINQWADFWDVAPKPLIDSLMKAQAARNAAIAKAEGL